MPGRTSGTRPKGKHGAGQGPAKGVGKGDGWGGPPQGASSGPRIDAGPTGDALRARVHDPDVKARREARIAAMRDKIFDLAENAQREETQLSAAIAFLNQEMGMPIQRSINANVDDPAKVVIITGVRRDGDPAPDN